jgi:uncharacterized membrane protein
MHALVFFYGSQKRILKVAVSRVVFDKHIRIQLATKLVMPLSFNIQYSLLVSVHRLPSGSFMELAHIFN